MAHLFFSSSFAQRRGLGLWFDSCLRIVSVLKSKIGEEEAGDSGEVGEVGEVESLVLRLRGAQRGASSLRCIRDSKVELMKRILSENSFSRKQKVQTRNVTIK